MMLRPFLYMALTGLQELKMQDNTHEYLYDTLKHIKRVQNILSSFVVELIKRGNEHDTSKLEEPELSYFAEHNHNLKKYKFRSPEYQESLIKLGPALEHHYSKNRHHPEYHEHGIDDMTLIDLIEMLADWKAASERTKDGNVLESIEKNGKHFQISPQLIRIFENTIKGMPE